MNGLYRCHPAVILCYYSMAFAGVIGFGHPVLNLIIILLSLLSYFCLVGIQKGMKLMAGAVLMSLFCVLLNPLFNHRGVTVLFQIGMTRFTLEALCYGIYMAEILVASLFLFAGLSKEMSAEKIMTLTGKRMPAFSLLFSMILRFVPKASKDWQAMKGIHGNKRSMVTALIGMELEQSMERSISMSDRHYGERKRTSYYAKKISVSDGFFLFFFFLAMGTMTGLVLGEGHKIQFFPSIQITRPSGVMIMLLILYYGVPIWMRGKEELQWILSRRKITDTTTRKRSSRLLQ